MMMSALKMTALRIALVEVLQVHDVERRNLGKRRHQHRRDDCEVFRDVVRDAEGGERSARDQHLFSDLDDVEQLRWIGIEIDHVAGFARGLCPGVHGNTHVGLRERRCVVRAVTGHGNQVTLELAPGGYVLVFVPASLAP